MKVMIEYKKNNFFKFIPFITIFILTFIILIQSPINIFSQNGVSGTDSSVFRTVAESIRKGYMPYKDSFDHKGPLMYLIDFLGITLGGYKGIWILEFLFVFITFFYIYKIANLRLNRLWSLGITVITGSLLTLFLEGGNLTEEFALPFIASSLYIFIDYFLNSKITILRLLFCGFSFAAVCLLRINMFSPWIAFGFIIFLKTLLNKEYKEMRQFIIFFFTGALILVIPIFMWLILNGTFLDFINAYFVFNFGYSSTGDAASVLNGLITRVFGIRLEILSAKNQFMNQMASSAIFLGNPVILISFAYTFINAIKKKDYFNIGYLLYFIITIILIAMGGRAYFHYGMILVPLIAYPLTNLIEYFLLNKKHIKSIVLFCVIFCTTLTMTFYGVRKSFNNCKNINDNSNIKIKIANYIKENTSENAYISVFGNDNILYLLSERKIASKYSYQSPIAMINEEIMKEYLEDLSLNEPEMIIVCVKNDEMNKYLKENNYVFVKEYTGAKIYINTK